MKTNPQSTFANRVAQFQKEQHVNVEEVKQPIEKSRSLQTGIYIQARLAVLKSYSPERLAVIRDCEQNKTLDCKEYKRFVYDILIAAGDVPTHELRKSTEECGCYSCKGKKSK